MKYLVTGRAGSGKSAVNQELQRRGYNSHDTDDYPGLASWVDTHTKQPVQVDPSHYVDYSKVDWDWNETTLLQILSEEGELFLCGSASNDLKFFHLFDRVFVLTVDPERQLKFLQERESPYGKDPKQQREIIREQAEFVEEALKLGAVAVANDRPLSELVDQILGISNDK